MSPKKTEAKRRLMQVCVGSVAALAAVVAVAQTNGTAVLGEQSAFETIVDANGMIARPQDDYLRDWVLLGSWAVSEQTADDVINFHNTYTTRDVVDEFRETGKWKDGAVLLKELRNTRNDDYTTGRASSATDAFGWFVMIKDTQNRFPENGLWGEGWGWAFYSADAPDTLITTDYEAECLGCHVPVQDTDWVYSHAYPALRKN